MYILIWIFGIVATYLLWGVATWLSIITIILVLSYQVSSEKQQEHDTKGMYDNITATRLGWTFALVLIIF